MGLFREFERVGFLADIPIDDAPNTANILNLYSLFYKLRHNLALFYAILQLRLDIIHQAI